MSALECSLSTRMSTLGSSVISMYCLLGPAWYDYLADRLLDKSGKKFAPKAPVRRGGAPSSAQTSARPSVDRQLQSQTPQPPALRHHAAPSPAPAPASVADPTSSQQPPPAAELAPTPHSNASTLIAVPTHKAATSSTAPVPVPVAIPVPQQSLPQPASQSTSQPIPRPVTRPTPQLAAQPVPQHTPQPQLQTAVSASIDHARPSTEQAAVPLNDEHHASKASTPAVVSNAPKSKTIAARKSFSASTLSKPSAPVTDASRDVPLISARASDSVPPARIESEHVSGSQPPAKRRRIERPQPDNPQDEVVTTDDITSAPVATIENGDLEEIVETTEADRPSGVPPKAKKLKMPAKEKGKKRLHARAQAMAEEIVADATRNEPEQAGAAPPKEPGRRGRRRVPTPENAEVVEIAPGLVKMADLCKDLRTGKKSKRETALQELDWTEVVRKQRERKRAVAAGEMPPPETVDQMLERVGRERDREQDMAQAVPNTIIVNGEIQLDQSSLQIDRHAHAQAERDAEQLEVVDESEITRRVNSGSWLKREKTESWDEEHTDLFYNGLRMFGTDFEMISKMFPGRTRRAIKLKFTKEEKMDKSRIKDTLLGERLPVDMAMFEKLSNTIYKDPKELEREMDEDRRRLEEEQAKERAAMDAALAERAAEAAAEGAAVGNDSSAKENEFGGEGAKARRGKKAGAKKKAGRGKGVVGGEVEVLGPLDGTA